MSIIDITPRPQPKQKKANGSKTLKLAKKRADTYFAKFIRLRDQDKPCITCGKYTDEKDCGHFISRRFETVRFDEKNCSGQCIRCNRFQNGNQFEHGLKIDQRHGKGTAEALYVKSKMKATRKKFDYDYLADYYREKIKTLTQSKTS